MAVVFGVVGLTFWVTQNSVREAAAEHAQVEREYSEATKKIDQVRAMQLQQQTVARQAELTASLLEKVPRSYLLAEITRSLPENVSLVDFGLESKVHVVPVTPGAAAATASPLSSTPAAAVKPPDPNPQPKAYDVTCKLTGLAINDVQVAQMIARLGRSKLFSDVNLVVSDEFGTTEPKMRKFQIEMILDPAANVTRDAGGAKSQTVSLDPA